MPRFERPPGEVQRTWASWRNLVILVALTYQTLAAGAEPPQFGDEGIAPGSQAMPELLWFKERSEVPIFVAAERVILSTGEVDPFLFRPAYASQITELLSLPQEDGCIRFIWGSSADIPPSGRTDLAKAIGMSDNVVVGTVTGRKFGFQEERPGVLIRFSLEELIKGSVKWGERNVFYPVADFHVGGVGLCANNPSYPKPPSIGDRILVLFAGGWVSDAAPLLVVGPTDLVTLPRRNVTELPEFYRRTDPGLKGSTPEATLKFVREHAEENGKQ